jgi:hypothetical protein
MKWLFSRRKPRRMTQASRRCRPTLLCLEERQLLSISVPPVVMPFTDPGSGAAGLLVRTEGANDKVTITDDPAAQTTTVVADGKMQIFDQLFTLFDLELMSKNDILTFDLASPLDGQQADVHVALGKGENHFTFNPDQTAITNHSDVNLDVLGNNGNDFVNLNFGEILESRVNVAATDLGGSKTLNSADVRSSITFGVEKTGIRNSSVDVNIGLGHGNNNFLFNYGADLGHLAGTGDPVAADFGPSTFNVNITGSNRRQDVANVTLFANGEVNTGSTLNFNTQFLAGNNNFKALFDANTFQIDDDGGEFISDAHLGGAAHFNVNGGSGNDNISFQSIHQDHTIELSGLFDINVHGGRGKDNINVNLGGPGGFTDDDPFELLATNRAFRLRVDGGVGDDNIKVNLSNANTATFDYDVAIRGGRGMNNITFVGVNPGGQPGFGPAGSVFIDGGSGRHNQVDVFGNFPVIVQNADS